MPQSIKFKWANTVQQYPDVDMAVLEAAYKKDTEQSPATKKEVIKKINVVVGKD